MDAPDEPLELSAPYAWQLAQQYCNRDTATGKSCAWNHGLWQFLRIMGLAGTAAHRGEFYRNAIRTCAAGNPAPRILISGTTDYAMLAQVIAAFTDMDATPSITVIDVCETPLRLNHWYAERLSCRMETARADILDYESAAGFDLICTDSLLGRFPHARWPQLAARWHALLRPGGSLLTASRPRPDSGPVPLVFEEDQILAFRDTVLAKARQLGLQTGISPEELAVAAEQYGRHQSNYPLRSAEQLQSLLENAGFSIDSMTASTRTVSNHDGIRAPTVPSGGKFLCVVARRP